VEEAPVSNVLWSKHRENVARAYEALEGKEALLEMWEPLEAENLEYVKELRRAVHRLRVRLLAMKPVGEFDDG
jgi:hypothetical protein